jgi:hypothetical protein
MRSQLPIPKIINGVVNAPVAITTNCSFEVIENKTISGVLIEGQVTVAATGGATKSVPTLAMVASEIRFLPGTNVNRRRFPASYWGLSGMLAINDDKDAGTVMYFQGAATPAYPQGTPVTAVVNGVTYGNTPVTIGSPEDIAIQAALANNTQTTAVFGVVVPFAEDFRKDVAHVEALALPIAYADANGNVVGTIAGSGGRILFQIDIPAMAGGLGNPTNVTITASEWFDERTLSVPATGSPALPKLVKEKIYQDQYAVGDVELADQFTNLDSLQAVSFLTISDPITKFIVKQGETIIRQSTWDQNLKKLKQCGFNTKNIPRNRLDIVFDENDDPSGALPLRSNAKLSIVCTFASINDAAKTVTIFPTFYGQVE